MRWWKRWRGGGGEPSWMNVRKWGGRSGRDCDHIAGSCVKVRQRSCSYLRRHATVMSEPGVEAGLQPVALSRTSPSSLPGNSR